MKITSGSQVETDRQTTCKHELIFYRSGDLVGSLTRARVTVYREAGSSDVSTTRIILGGLNIRRQHNIEIFEPLLPLCPQDKCCLTSFGKIIDAPTPAIRTSYVKAPYNATLSLPCFNLVTIQSDSRTPQMMPCVPDWHESEIKRAMAMAL